MTDVLRAFKLRRYYAYRFDPENPDRPLLDLKQFGPDEKGMLPWGFMPTSDEKVLASSEDRYYTSGLSYTAVKGLNGMMALTEALLPKDRTGATMILENRRCHFYGDLDADKKRLTPDRKHDLDDVTAVVKSHWELIDRVFEETYGRPMLDRKARAASWERRRPGKMSVHLHLPTEYWDTPEELRAFIQGPLFEKIQNMAFAGDKEALKFGMWVDDIEGTACKNLYHKCPKRGFFLLFLDIGVYTKNRIFGLPGHTKPGTPPLLFHSGPAELRNSLREQIRYALPSFTFIEPPPDLKIKPKPSLIPAVAESKQQSQLSLVHVGSGAKSELYYIPIKSGPLQLPDSLWLSETKRQRERVELLVNAATHKTIVWNRLQCSRYFVQGYTTYRENSKKRARDGAAAAPPARTCALGAPESHVPSKQCRKLKVFAAFRDTGAQLEIVCASCSAGEGVIVKLRADDIAELFPHANASEDTIDAEEFASVFWT